MRSIFNAYPKIFDIIWFILFETSLSAGFHLLLIEILHSHDDHSYTDCNEKQLKFILFQKVKKNLAKRELSIDFGLHSRFFDVFQADWTILIFIFDRMPFRIQPFHESIIVETFSNELIHIF